MKLTLAYEALYYWRNGSYNGGLRQLKCQVCLTIGHRYGAKLRRMVELHRDAQQYTKHIGRNPKTHFGSCTST